MQPLYLGVFELRAGTWAAADEDARLLGLSVALQQQRCSSRSSASLTSFFCIFAAFCRKYPAVSRGLACSNSSSCAAAPSSTTKGEVVTASVPEASEAVVCCCLFWQEHPFVLHPHQPPAPAVWGGPPGYHLGGLHARGGRGGAGHFGGPRGGQQGPRGGRREGPHHYSRQPDSLSNLPIPPGALCDPWAPLSAQQGGPLPLEAPTDEVLEELKAEVARQLQLQRLSRQGEKEAPEHSGGPSSSGEGVPLSAEGYSQLQQGGPSDENREAADSKEDKSPSSQTWVTPEEAFSTFDAGVPSATISTTGRRRPLMLPPPTFDTGAPDGAGWEGAASTSNLKSNPNSNSSSSGSAAASTPDGSSLSLPLGDSPTRGPRGFLLPAVSVGGLPQVWLSLDEEGICKKVRGAPFNE
ncbi:hypothetical protein Esti_004717 [Eimeria stiedai]